MRIDVQGAQTIRRLVPEAVLIFLSAESEEALIRRLRQRKTEPEDQLKMRIATARQELKRLEMFDYVVINAEGQLDQPVKILPVSLPPNDPESNNGRSICDAADRLR